MNLLFNKKYRRIDDQTTISFDKVFLHGPHVRINFDIPAQYNERMNLINYYKFN